MYSQWTSCSSITAVEVFVFLRSCFHVKSPTMHTMSGRDAQRRIRLMGSSARRSSMTKGCTVCSVLPCRNRKEDFKSRNAAVLFSLVSTWHLHFLLLSSICSVVTRVMLHRVFSISLYLHKETVVRTCAFLYQPKWGLQQRPKSYHTIFAVDLFACAAYDLSCGYIGFSL